MTNSAHNLPQTDLARLQRSANGMSSWQSALQSLRNQQYAPALVHYRSLTRQFPGVSQLWTELGAAAAGELDFTLACQATKRAADLAANDVPLLVSIGKQYCHLGNTDLATTCFERAVLADPSSANARLTLASWLERNGELDQAQACIDACLTSHPNHGRALYLKAFLLHRRGKNTEAETILRDLLRSPLLPLEGQFTSNHLLGIVLDALSQYDQALEALVKGKMLQRQSTSVSTLENLYDKVDESRRALLSNLTSAMVRQWRETSSSNPQSPAFLGGAPRSGTTLIERILGAHPDVLAFDEPEASARELLIPLNPLPPNKGLTLESLNNLSPAECARLTSRYLKSLLREPGAEITSKLLLDKNPSTTAWLHIWLRLLPQSKILIALRDPRDVVVSCFFQNIALNGTSVNFLSWERTARFYADCMDVWLRMRELGGFEWMEARYEDVVGNLEGEGKRVTNFLGLQWHESQARYYEKANDKFLSAPTYNEVTKPIYTRARGRWEHYAKALAPIEPMLQKYLGTFGYA